MSISPSIPMVRTTNPVGVRRLEPTPALTLGTEELLALVQLIRRADREAQPIILGTLDRFPGCGLLRECLERVNDARTPVPNPVALQSLASTLCTALDRATSNLR